MRDLRRIGGEQVKVMAREEGMDGAHGGSLQLGLARVYSGSQAASGNQ